MLMKSEFLRASADARRVRIGTVVAADPRVRFAHLAAFAHEAASTEPARPCVAVYVDPAADAEAAGRDVAMLLSAHPDTTALDVAVLNTMEPEEAGRILHESELLLERDRAARIEFEARASMAYLDFREHEQVFLRERAERPFGDTTARMLAALDLRIGRLKMVDGISVEEYAADWMTASAVERELEVAVVLCIDLVRHALAERKLGMPRTYRGLFAAARDAGLVEADLAAALMRMCGFRNLLAHEGHRLEPAAVVAALGRGMDDIARFRDAAARW